MPMIRRIAQTGPAVWDADTAWMLMHRKVEQVVYAACGSHALWYNATTPAAARAGRHRSAAGPGLTLGAIVPGHHQTGDASRWAQARLALAFL